MALPTVLAERLRNLWVKLQINNLWQRILRYTVALTLTVIIAIIPASGAVLGPYAFLGPLTAVFGNPGQRLGLMVESLGMIVVGSLLGVAWSCLGLYLSGLAWGYDLRASYTIKAVFLVVAAIFHGFFRSYSPRVFNFVLFHSFVSTIMLASAPHSVTRTFVIEMIYPILCAAGILLVVNILVFPEFSSSNLGATTIETLAQASATLKDAAQWFTTSAATLPEGGSPMDLDRPLKRHRAQSFIGNPFKDPLAHERVEKLDMDQLTTLTEAKVKLRAKLKACKSLQQECTFELTYAVLPPRSLKPINNVTMPSLVQGVISLIGACESKYALLGTRPKPEVFEAHLEAHRHGGPGKAVSPVSEPENTTKDRDTADPSNPNTTLGDKVKLIKPQREVETGDVEVLESILAHLRGPVKHLQTELNQVLYTVQTCLAYAHDVSRLPSGATAPRSIKLEEVDLRADAFAAAVTRFNTAATVALETAASTEHLRGSQVDLLPRVEIFLISSFVLSLKQIAEQSHQSLKHARTLVEKRQSRHSRRRLYFPRRIRWRQWLSSGGEQDVAILQDSGRKEARSGMQQLAATDDNEDLSDTEDDSFRRALDVEGYIPSGNLPARRTSQVDPMPTNHSEAARPPRGTFGRLRKTSADLLDTILQSDDIPYALKLALAIVLVSWPAFIASTSSWYNAFRGVWAPLQLWLVFEVSIGTSLWVFTVRAAGVIFGCVVGFLAYLIGRGNLPALVILLQLGIIPSAYVQLGTPYVKAGMISVVSMTVVALSTVDQSGAAWENFVKRMCAFLVGGAAALLVQVAVYPVRARERLVESLSSCLRQMINMQAAVAAGIDDPAKVDFRSVRLQARFGRAKNKATAALAAADTFLPFCLTEPRLKGDFGELQPIYKEITYVLYQIIDRMDNVVHLRKAYGSSILETLNEEVHVHRRNVAASVTLALFAVSEALTTKLPLPQFLPSSRLAQVRLVHRVREVLAGRSLIQGESRRTSTFHLSHATESPVPLDQNTIEDVTQQNFLSWSAAAAGQMEIIEYLEELVDLTKLLVGVNAFRAGMLEHPHYRQYVGRIKKREAHLARFNRLSEAGRSAAVVDGSDAEDGDADVYLRRYKTSDPRGATVRRGSATAAAAALRNRRYSAGILPPSLFRVGTRLQQASSIEQSMTAAEQRRHGRGQSPGEGKGKGLDETSP